MGRTLSEKVSLANKRINRTSKALLGKGSFLAQTRQSIDLLYGDTAPFKFSIKGKTPEERKLIEEAVDRFIEARESTAKGRKEIILERLSPVLEDKFGISDKVVGKLLKIFDSEQWEKIRELTSATSELVVDMITDAIESKVSNKKLKTIFSNYISDTKNMNFMDYFNEELDKIKK